MFNRRYILKVFFCPAVIFRGSKLSLLIEETDFWMWKVFRSLVKKRERDLLVQQQAMMHHEQKTHFITPS